MSVHDFTNFNSTNFTVVTSCITSFFVSFRSQAQVQLIQSKSRTINYSFLTSSGFNVFSHSDNLFFCRNSTRRSQTVRSFCTNFCKVIHNCACNFFFNVFSHRSCNITNHTQPVDTTSHEARELFVDFNSVNICIDREFSSVNQTLSAEVTITIGNDRNTESFISWNNEFIHVTQSQVTIFYKVIKLSTQTFF